VLYLKVIFPETGVSL